MPGVIVFACFRVDKELYPFPSPRLWPLEMNKMNGYLWMGGVRERVVEAGIMISERKNTLHSRTLPSVPIIPCHPRTGSRQRRLPYRIALGYIEPYNVSPSDRTPIVSPFLLRDTPRGTFTITSAYLTSRPSHIIPDHITPQRPGRNFIFSHP